MTSVGPSSSSTASDPDSPDPSLESVSRTTGEGDFSSTRELWEECGDEEDAGWNRHVVSSVLNIEDTARACNQTSIRNHMSIPR